MKNMSCKVENNTSTRSEEFHDSVTDAAQGIGENNTEATRPGSLEVEVRMVNPDMDSMQRRG